MFKKKIIYTDIPSAYDEEARRLARRVGTFLLTLFVIAVIIIPVNL